MSGFNFLKPPASSAASTGGLFGSASAQPSGGLFGNTGGQQQSSQSGGLFGNSGTQQQTQQSGGLFGNTAGQQQSQQSGGLFGNTSSQQQPQQSTGQFGNTSGLFNQQPQQQPQQQSSGLFGNTGGLFNNPAPNRTTNMQNLSGAPPTQPSTRAQIDVEHLRPTTKFDALTPSLQSEIESLESHILSEGSKCRELTGALPSIIQSGKDVPESYTFVRAKFDELALALENDAADIVELRDQVVRRDVAEGRLCWKSVDRLKMPAQYQTRGAAPHHGGGSETVYGGSGLSGWWNNPTMSTRSRHAGRRQGNVVSVEEDADVEVAGGTLVDLLNGRAEEMAEMVRERRELLGEIEGFVGNVEGKILARERDVLVGSREGGGAGERDRQINMLRYVFGEVERSLFEVAERVGESRDGLMELGERSVRAKLGY